MRWFLWWAALAVIYFVEVATPEPSEAVAAVFIAVCTTAIVAAALHSSQPSVSVDWRSLHHLRRVPARVLRDVFVVTKRILEALVRGETLNGRITRIAYEVGDPSSAADQGREAMVIFGICAAPNSIVADVDPRGALIVHQLTASSDTQASRRWPL